MTSPRDALFPQPLRVAFEGYDPKDERRRESLFGLGNGRIFVRACPVEAEAEDQHHYPGTYRAGCYDRRILTPDANRCADRLGHDSLVNLPNWLVLTFRVLDDGGSGSGSGWFSLRRCDVLEYRHTLNLADGTAERHVLFRDAAGRRTRWHEERLVSMTRPSIAALRVRLRPDNWHGRIEIRSAIDGATANHNTDHHTLPGYRHLHILERDQPETGTIRLQAQTRHSRISVAIATRTRVAAAFGHTTAHCDVCAAEHMQADIAQGETLTIVKTAAIVTARDPATSEAGEASLRMLACTPDFDTLRTEQAGNWARLRARASIQAEQETLQRAADFHIFHLLQTVSPHSVQVDVGLPSRGWQEAYHGQIFWDELFSFSFLNHRFPEIARGLLLYRYRRLPQARQAALRAGYSGALFPWRSATTGEEETPRFQFNPMSGHWLADHTHLQHHIGAAIAHNAWHYALATGDTSFLAEYGAELIVEIARFWASFARYDAEDDRYDLRGVIGPDEYHNFYPGAKQPGLDNNAYTNVMAASTLRLAEQALDRLPPRHRQEVMQALNITPEERAGWHRISRRIRLCFHDDGVISQFQGFDTLKPFDAAAFTAAHPDGRVDWMLEANGDTVDGYQVTKQADVLMLLYLLQPDDLTHIIRDMGYDMDTGRLWRTVDYYLARISHESSLSRVVCAGALAWLDRSLSWRFFEQSQCIDLTYANSASAEEGLHLGAMVGMLDVLQRHYLGLRVRGGRIVLSPAPPPELGAVRMTLQHLGCALELDWDGASLHLRSDTANTRGLDVEHAGECRVLSPGGTMSVPAGTCGSMLA